MDLGLAALLLLAGLFAGFVDSIVGGGGIITLPALLATGMPAHLAVGTNKVVGTGASGIATWNYARHGLLQGRLIAIGFPLAAVAGLAGATIIVRVPEQAILYGVSAIMAAMVVWVLVQPGFGLHPRYPGLTPYVIGIVATLAAVLGFYDGLLGPGTGTMLLFGLVVLTGMPFMQAAVHGRMINLASNLGALVYFAFTSNVDWRIGGIMAIGTVTGGYIGSRSNIRSGAKWVRPLFVIVAAFLLIRLIWTFG